MARGKRGRPREKNRDRYESGRVKPHGPNETIIAKRRAGDAAAGEHPLDFALSQDWLTERQHRDAMAYRSIYQGAHIGGPKLSSGSLTEVPPKEGLTMNWSQMSDDEIVAIWDEVFSEDMPEPIDPEETRRQALARWRVLNAHLSPAEQQQLFLVAVMGSWPFWMTRRSEGRALGPQDRDRLNALLSGVSGVGRALRPPKRGSITPVPYNPPRRPGTEIPVRYEDQHGQPVIPKSKDGRPFDVVTVARRR